MNEIIFTHDISLDKFKAHINQYRDKDIERFLETIYMYIELVGTEEMNKRIHLNKDIDLNVERELRGVKVLANTLDNFLKNSGQIH